MAPLSWTFYGRDRDLAAIQALLDRRRWFFAKVTGRRRIGKTTLLRRALANSPHPTFYVQIPDSAPAGVISAVNDAFDVFQIPPEVAPRPPNLAKFASAIGKLVRAGYIVVIDEFQYFHRKHLQEFASYLQIVVDDLSAPGKRVTGGLIALGSLHTEMEALLDDRRAPLFHRVTHPIELDHLDLGSVMAILRDHGAVSPERLLFLWNLFEGVPKFYRDAHDADALGASRAELLRRLFFASSAPLRTEADHWFLHELRGRYEVILRHVARHPGCTNGDIIAHLRELEPGGAEQTGGYLTVLVDKFRIIARRQPVLARATARSGRYYVTDNFLRAWLDALAKTVVASQFRPEAELIALADRELARGEGHGLEKLVATLYAERSRKGLAGFALTARVEGYWDSADTEIDLVAVDETSETIRYGSCKRDPDKLHASLTRTEGHIQRFLAVHREFAMWRTQKVAIAPALDAAARAAISARGWIPEDLADLTAGL